MSPPLLVDLTHAHSWDARERSFRFEMGGPGVYALDGARRPAGATTGFRLLPGVPGVWLLRLARLARLSSKVVLSADGRRATVFPTLVHEHFPLTALGRAQVRVDLERVAGAGGAWRGAGFRPPSNATAAARFSLRPLLARERDGSWALSRGSARLVRLATESEFETGRQQPVHFLHFGDV